MCLMFKPWVFTWFSRELQVSLSSFMGFKKLEINRMITWKSKAMWKKFGHSQRGAWAPQSIAQPSLSPPNEMTLCTGLWKAAILSPCQPLSPRCHLVILKKSLATPLSSTTHEVILPEFNSLPPKLIILENRKIPVSNKMCYLPT